MVMTEQHDYTIGRESGFGFVAIACHTCGRYFTNDAAHNTHAAQEAA